MALVPTAASVPVGIPEDEGSGFRPYLEKTGAPQQKVWARFKGILAFSHFFVKLQRISLNPTPQTWLRTSGGGIPRCFGRGLGHFTKNQQNNYWVDVKELNLRYYIRETLLFAICTHSGNLI